MKVYSVYDSKVEVFEKPMFMRNKGEALRAWQTAVNDDQTMFCKFPSDYTLFEIGEFDELTGTITPHKAKIALGLALEFKRQPEASAPLLQAIEAAKGN